MIAVPPDGLCTIEQQRGPKVEEDVALLVRLHRIWNGLRSGIRHLRDIDSVPSRDLECSVKPPHPDPAIPQTVSDYMEDIEKLVRLLLWNLGKVFRFVGTKRDCQL